MESGIDWVVFELAVPEQHNTSTSVGSRQGEWNESEFDGSNSPLMECSNSQSGELLTIMPHKNIVYHAAFNPHGGQVATVSTDDIVQLWRIFPNTQALIDHARQIVPHPLTQEQRQQFFLE